MHFLVKIVIKCSVCLFSVLSEPNSPQHLLIVLGWSHLHCLGQLHWSREKWRELVQETCLSPDSQTNVAYVLSNVESTLKFIYVSPHVCIMCSHTHKHICMCIHHTHAHTLTKAHMHACTHIYTPTHHMHMQKMKVEKRTMREKPEV